MAGRLIVAYDAVDLADSVNQVIVFLILPNIFNQPARTILNRPVVLRVELRVEVLGGVVKDADYLIADLIAISLQSARDRVIGARMIAGLVSGRNSTTVAPFFNLAILFGEPDLFRSCKDVVERV